MQNGALFPFIKRNLLQNKIPMTYCALEVSAEAEKSGT